MVRYSATAAAAAAAHLACTARAHAPYRGGSGRGHRRRRRATTLALFAPFFLPREPESKRAHSGYIATRGHLRGRGQDRQKMQLWRRRAAARENHEGWTQQRNKAHSKNNYQRHHTRDQKRKKKKKEKRTPTRFRGTYADETPKRNRAASSTHVDKHKLRYTYISDRKTVLECAVREIEGLQPELSV